ncbi:MAG: carbohydrate ABC transporter permease, partial [Microlunatus sp.]|nr:carbohydrate ABC transporter permease [Microlunatus sp.]
MATKITTEPGVGVSATAARASRASRRGDRPRLTIGTWIRLIILSAGCFTVLMPVVWMVLTSLKPADQVFVQPPALLFRPRWRNYIDVLTLVPFQRYILNTATIVGLVVLGTLLSCSFCAYGFARLRAPGRKVIFLVLMAT